MGSAASTPREESTSTRTYRIRPNWKEEKESTQRKCHVCQLSQEKERWGQPPPPRIRTKGVKPSTRPEQ